MTIPTPMVQHHAPERTALTAGDILVDPVYHERYVVRATAHDTAGAFVRVEDVAAPGPSRRQVSAHPQQEEQFTVLQGTLGLLVGTEEHLLRAGDTFTVPAGVRHRPRNAGTDDLRFVAEIRPALRFEAFLAAITAVNQSGARGVGYLLRAAMVLAQFPDVERPPPLPRVVEHVIFRTLAIGGRLLGYDVPTLQRRRPHVDGRAD